MSSLTPRDYSVVRPPHSRYCWTDNEMRILIRERTRRNHEYWYNYPGQNRSQFWNSIASTVNSTCNSSYTGMQCSVGQIGFSYDEVTLLQMTSLTAPRSSSLQVKLIP